MITLRFSNNEQQMRKVLVNYHSSLSDETDLDENFHVSNPIGLDTFLERKLFYFIDQKKWTLNELIFFANNNNLCLTLLSNSTIIAQYGICGGGVCEGAFKINAQCFLLNEAPLKIN